MEEDNIQNEININIDEIGYIAKLIDQEMTISERMKLKKTTIARIACAVAIYMIIMIVFTIIL